MNKDINKIVETLKKYSEAYYSGNQIVDDATYDTLELLLKRLDPDNAYFSQTREATTSMYGIKRKHLYGFIGSIVKIHSIDESKVLSFSENNSAKYTISAKLDGTSMTAYFKNGKLLYALSRADGYEGYDLTDKYLKITEKYNLNIPADFTGGLRGEVVMSNDSWKIYKKTHSDAAMQRNTGTGLLARKDVCEDVGLLDWVLCEVLATTDASICDSFNELEYLSKKNFGYPVVPYVSGLSYYSDKDLEKFRDTWAEVYPLDGVVFKTNVSSFLKNDVYEIESLKEAYKFEAESKETTVRSIEWTLQKSGRLIPVIEMMPIELSGALVRRATGNNAAYILLNHLGKGSKIVVKRANEVIPHVDTVLSESTEDIPKTCPYCGSDLSWDGVHLVCSNDNCTEKNRLFVYNFLRVCSEDMKGVGDSIYDLIAGQTIGETLKNLNKDFSRFTKHQQSVIADIHDKIFNHMTPIKVLESVGVDGLGSKAIKKLEKNQDWVLEYIEGRNTDFPKFLGPALISEMQKQIYSDRLKILCAALLYNFIEIKASANVKSEDLNNIKVRYYCVTGALEGLSRSQFEVLCESKGWQMSSIKKAECLITNDTSTGSAKNLEAQRLGKKIYSQKEFMTKFLSV